MHTAAGLMAGRTKVDCRMSVAWPLADARYIYCDFLGAAVPLTYLPTSVAAWNCRAPTLTPS